MKVLLLYFLIINFTVFIIAGYDKYQAQKNKRRIPENTLFSLAFFGGSIGLLLAMLLFRHKTSKSSFIVKFCGILGIQITLIIVFLNYKK
ncbi:DUF1294 domain-containing protein [Flavobacterium salmonis]|uniref:DUF1294 domain-containing protein n=1 Tax=Flavobacterium salmonis TaxID=2654844 RepID=A0A6V6YYN0_9FLAO|nr:DUF1294 domain-containing protein [Flavobacterium salmonis]CAD0003782.1 hypothetical protein FLAT13_01858 [Flavobacterium salmonis]